MVQSVRHQNFMLFLEGPVVGIHVSVYFLDDSMNEFLSLWLSKHLLKIHDITYHLDVELS